MNTNSIPESAAGAGKPPPRAEPTRKVLHFHTPGPWHIATYHQRTRYRNSPGELIYAGAHGHPAHPDLGPPVALCLNPLPYCHTSERTANARLIAAAPDLLAICQEIAAQDTHAGILPLADTAERLRAAIAKYTGEQP